MTNGWTGGQYSVYRLAFGLFLLLHFARLLRPDAAPLGAPLAASAAGLAAAFAFALGWRDRVAAVLAGLAWAYLRLPGLPILGGLLLAHVCVPARPFGALDARGRPDPGGGWSLPRAVYAAVWPGLALVCAHAAGGTARAGALGLSLALLALWGRARPWLWLALLGTANGDTGVWLLLGLAFDPGWIPPRRERSAALATLFYDGACGLCHGAVRFVLAEDRAAAFRFAPLESEAFARAVPAEIRRTLPDSLVLALPDDRVLVRAAAVREVAARLGGLWRALALASLALPVAWLDRGYDAVARVRGRLFARPSEACPRLPPELRARFLA